MIPFKLDGHSFDLPQNHGELTVNQFLSLRKLKDTNLISILSILSGISEDFWNNTSDTDIDNKIAPYLEWMGEKFEYDSFILPKEITIGVQKFKVPDSIAVKTFGQKIAIQTLLEDCAKKGIDEVEVIDQAIQIYFEQPLNQIGFCRLDEAFPVASFFFESWRHYLLTNQKNLAAKEHQSKQEQDSIGSTSSDTSGLSTRLRRALINLSTRFLKWTITRSLQHSGMKRKLTNARND